MADSDEDDMNICSDKNFKKTDHCRDMVVLPVKGPPSDEYQPPVIPPLPGISLLIGDTDALPVKGPPSDEYQPPVIPLFTGIQGLQSTTTEKRQKDSGYSTSKNGMENHDDEEGGQGTSVQQPSKHTRNAYTDSSDTTLTGFCTSYVTDTFTKEPLD